MAGITDRPFREICFRFGAGLTTSEMVASDPKLRKSQKSQQRLTFSSDGSIRSVQIVGADPLALALAAKANVDEGAQIIDINMGCPAKKVCNVYAGSALLKNEKLVANILETVVNSVDVPVTLKTRIGWDKKNKNGLLIAKIAEDCGIQAIAIHGRTRECGYKGEAEYDIIADVKSCVAIPVIANGDITSAEKAKKILDKTGVDAVMIGRAAQGNPWIFQEIKEFLKSNIKINSPSLEERKKTLTEHITNLYDFYGEFRGLRIARKHINWYCSAIEGYTFHRKVINNAISTTEQLDLIEYFFHQSLMQGDKAA